MNGAPFLPRNGCSVGQFEGLDSVFDAYTQFFLSGKYGNKMIQFGAVGFFVTLEEEVFGLVGRDDGRARGDNFGWAVIIGL